MANHESAKKAMRHSRSRNDINKQRRERIKTLVKKVEQAITQGNKEEAAAAFKVAQPELMRGVQKNLHKKNTAARKVSRLAQKIKKIA